MAFHRSVVAIAFVSAATAGPLGAESHTDGDMGAAQETTSEISGDAKAGERVFRRCLSCHAVGEGAANRIGPVLNGVVGRRVASVEGFDYSQALQDKAAEVEAWTPEELQAFLEQPRDYAPGTKMVFMGLRKPEDRDNVIAYLATLPHE